MKIVVRGDIDPYSYQVNGFIVTVIPYGKEKKKGYACQCGLLYHGGIDFPGDKEYTWPCGHIEAVAEWLEGAKV